MSAAMARVGMDVILSLPGHKLSDKIQADWKENYKLHFREPLFKNPKLDKYLNYRSVKKCISEYDPDVCYLRYPLLLKQVLTSGKPIIIELHNNALHSRSVLLDRYWRKLLIKSVKQGNVIKVICISQALSDYWIKQGIPADKIHTAHDGIEPDMFKNPLSREEARKKVGLSNESKIVSYIGRLYEDRNIDHIIKLAVRFKNENFIIVGGPESQKKKYKELADKQNIKNITFTGQLPHNEVSDYLYASDILLALWSSKVPTINYCSPLKIFEYMAAERVLIAHGFPTIKEVLTHNYNSLLVEPDSLDDLCLKTEQALEIKYPSSIAEQAKKDVFKKYTWDSRAISIFESLEIR